MPGLAVIAHTVWGAAGSSLHDPRNRLGDALGRRRDLAVAVEGGRITAVVPAAEARGLGGDRVVDLGDATLPVLLGGVLEFFRIFSLSPRPRRS